MQKIFISYKRQDKEKVFKIVDDIKSKTGVDCWIDLEGIESGDQFQNVIIKAINNADIVIFMLSKNFIAPYRDEKTGEVDETKQTFPEKEVMYALRHNKRLVPVSIDGTRIDACGWLEFNCASLDCIDYSNMDHRNKLHRNLIKWTDSRMELENPAEQEEGEELKKTIKKHTNQLPYFVKDVNIGIWIQTIVFAFIAIQCLWILFVGHVGESPSLRFNAVFLVIDLLAIIVCTVRIKKHPAYKWTFLLLDIVAIYFLMMVAHGVYSYHIANSYEYSSVQYKMLSDLGQSRLFVPGFTYFIFTILYIFHNAMVHIFMNSRTLYYKLPNKFRKMLKRQ